MALRTDGLEESGAAQFSSVVVAIARHHFAASSSDLVDISAAPSFPAVDPVFSLAADTTAGLAAVAFVAITSISVLAGGVVAASSAPVAQRWQKQRAPAPSWNFVDICGMIAV